MDDAREFYLTNLHLKPFKPGLKHYIDRGVLKVHHGVVSEYLELRMLNQLPNSDKKPDHPLFELKSTRWGAQVTLANFSDDYLQPDFKKTHIYKKCKSMVYVPQEWIDGEKVFSGFYHITADAWASIMDKLEENWNRIYELANRIGIENLKQMTSSNFANTEFLQLYRCNDRIDSEGKLKRQYLRVKIKWSLMLYLIDFEINKQHIVY